MKPILYFAGYKIILALMFLAIMSVISFFHFLLNHKFSLIESWAHRNGWEIIIIAKILAFYLLLKIIEVKFSYPKFLKRILKKKLKTPDWRLIAFTLFTFAYLYYAGSPEINEDHFQLTFTLLSIIGVFIFYTTDFLLIYVIDQAFPERRVFRRLINLLVFAFLFYQANNVIIPFQIGYQNFTLFQFFTILLLFEIYRENWINPIVYILLLACPLSAFYGMDPIWGEDYSFFRISRQPDIVLILILWVISIYYLYRGRLMKRSSAKMSVQG